MSVLARKRKPSRYEFYTNAIKLRRQLVFLLLHDLGIKKKTRDIKVTTEGMEAQDADLLLGVLERYGITSFPGEYPEWLIDKFRTSLWDILRDMHLSITRAYSIWATNLSEAYERRNHMNRAIAACESILQELQFAIEVLPVDAEKYMRHVDIVEREIELLKGWRKSDNKRIKELGQGLSAVASASRFCNANEDGEANYNDASNANANGGIRPLLKGSDGKRPKTHSRE